MTVSGSTDFSLSAVDVVTQARTLLGIQAEEEPLADFELQRGIRIANMMFKAWQADGVRTWVTAEGGPVTLIQGQASYVFGAAGDVTVVPYEMEQIRITRGGTDLEMLPIGRQDYFAMPIKTNQGFPTQYYYDRQRDSATLYLWPVPDATAATLSYTYQRVIDDIDASTDSLDLPQEWYEAIVYGLARRLVPYYGKADSPNAKLVMIESERSYQVVKNFDTGEGEGEISIVPAGYAMGSRR